MIVRNEAGQLAECLAPVASLFDEIVIVDTGSSDATKEVAARFEKGGMLLTQADCKIMAGHRDKAGIPEVHDADTDVFYIVDGDATFVVGGKVMEPKLESPGETRGLRIEGGEARKITKGDVLMIPRGVPHWFSEVPKMVNYFVVKVTASKKDK